jgi:hypothetical protein
MSHGILIELDPSLFAILVATGMATAGLLLGVTGGGVVSLLGRILNRRGGLQ